MSKLRSHKDLDLWKFAMQLAKQTYLASANFPKEEIYGLTAQIRRAAASVPSNIAEGAARKGSKEFCHFLYIALGSLAELETQWIHRRNPRVDRAGGESERVSGQCACSHGGLR
jgi:four helix bundle protein